MTRSIGSLGNHRRALIPSVIKSRRLKWAGHVARTPPSKYIRQVLESKEASHRSQWRPQIRWEYNIAADARRLGVPDWRDACQSRPCRGTVYRAPGPAPVYRQLFLFPPSLNTNFVVFSCNSQKKFLENKYDFRNQLYMIQFVYPAVDSLDGIPGAKFEKTINNKIKSICFILFL